MLYSKFLYVISNISITAPISLVFHQSQRLSQVQKYQ